MILLDTVVLALVDMFGVVLQIDIVFTEEEFLSDLMFGRTSGEEVASS